MYTFISSLVTAIGFGLCMFSYNRFKGENWSIKRTMLTTIRFFILYYSGILLVKYIGILK
ncbi:hypothetical protein D1093_05050 [Bartonella kosoyi]|uniref:Uncharacterized protein n=1 Tax=Bartonella kosoyi TaxID=2133959 RepID=A0A5B9CXX1_9HYPH|nr:hypothetical protein D1093_05050 [Bartonella kosoyi]